MNSQVNNSKRFYIHTLGCRVNQYESEAIRELLLKSEFKECLSREIADIYIINTCTVTQHADKKSRYLIGLFHRTNPKASIVVTGCYAENNADDLSFLPGVAHIVPNKNKDRIAELLAASSMQVTEGIRTPLAITDFKGHVKAFVKIQDGCENFCSYCKVPQVRGRLWSKPLCDIVSEVKGLVIAGFKEIVLSGICLGAWGKDLEGHDPAGIKSPGIVDVLNALDDIKGDFRIRLSSIEPKYVTDKLIDYIASNDRVCKHLHIPLQSGDDEILRKMNRTYTVAGYKALIEKVCSKIENVAITTDVLIGFPGESDENFANTLNLIRDIMPLRVHIFTFSSREGTAAHRMRDQAIGEKKLKNRYYELKAVALGASCVYREKFLNKKLNVLVETKRDKHSGLLTGYSDNYIKMLFEGPDGLIRKIVPVRVKDMTLLQTRGIYVASR